MKTIVPVPCNICGSLPDVVDAGLTMIQHKARCPNADDDAHRFLGNRAWKYGKTMNGAIRHWNDSQGFAVDDERTMKPLCDVTPCPVCSLRGPHECLAGAGLDAFVRDGEQSIFYYVRK